MKSTLLPYQQRAAEYAVTHPRKSVMLGMPMASGKTITSLGISEMLDCRCVFVGCPSAVILGWSKEMIKHLDNLHEWVVVFGGKKLRVMEHGVLRHVRKDPSGAQKADQLRRSYNEAKRTGRRFMFVTNHEAAWQPSLSKLIRDLPLDLIIADEIHKLKDPKGKASKWYHQTGLRAKRLNPECRLVGLTGTLMPHSPLDVFGQFRFLDETLFGRSYFRFKNQYAVLGGYGGKQVVGFMNQEELFELVASMTFQVPKSVIDLPREHLFVTDVQLSKEGFRVYNAMEESLCVEFNNAGGVSSFASVENPLSRLLRLQQVCSGYIPEDPDGPFDDPVLRRVDDSKELALSARLEVLPEDEPAVVFTRFKPDIETVRARCDLHGRKCLELSGKQDDLEEWLAEEETGGASILAVQIQAGGVGVELQRASFAMYYSLGFNLGDYLQSIARLARPGYKKDVVHYEHLIATNTVDTETYWGLKQRRKLVEEAAEAVDKISLQIAAMEPGLREDIMKGVLRRSSGSLEVSSGL